jgi:excisionase family DNA binding protein
MVLGVSLEHAYKLIHKKEFSFIQIGKRLLLPNLPLKKRSFVRVAKRAGS